jgi:RNA polymerase sigma-70 factor (ECF subfamily)
VLVERARAGDGVAYGELVRRHRPAAVRVATAVLRGRSGGGADADADDVVQAAVERAWRAVAGLQADRGFRPWFLAVVANGARNERRARGRRARLALRVAAADATRAVPTPEDVAVRAAEHAAVAGALGHLPDGDRALLALRHARELSERDIAAALDCPPGTVKSRLSRARGRLRAQLGTSLAVAAALALAAGLVAPVRQAVAGWLGVGTTRIEQVPDGRGDPDGLPPLLDGLRLLAGPVAAEQLLGRPLPRVDGDARAGAWHAPPGEAGVVLAWRDGDHVTTLWVAPAPGPGEPPGRVKVVTAPAASAGPAATQSDGGAVVDGPRRPRVVPIAGLGDEALLVRGAHVLVAGGGEWAAGTAVLWVADGLELRLETTLRDREAVTLARSVVTGV